MKYFRLGYHKLCIGISCVITKYRVGTFSSAATYELVGVAANEMKGVANSAAKIAVHRWQAAA